MRKTIEPAKKAKSKEKVPVNASFGTKRICPSCSGKFYDLNKNPANCPSCKHSFDPTVVLRARRGRKKADAQAAAAREAARKKELSLEDIEIEVEEVGDPVEDIEVMDDADDLEDIEEDIDTLEDHHPHSSSDDDDADDETIMEDLGGDAVLIDELDSESVYEEDEEEAPKPKKKKKK